jgi:hypothetical protein
MPIYLLLAMQAAGMITDYLGTEAQSRFNILGGKVQQAGIEANIEQTRLETEDESLQSLRQLRQALGTQLATFAARGTDTGQGSAALFMNQTVGTFKEDERMRRMNLMGKENSLKAGRTISKLNQMGENTKLWTGFASRTINRFSSSGYGKEGFGLTSKGSA